MSKAPDAVPPQVETYSKVGFYRGPRLPALILALVFASSCRSTPPYTYTPDASNVSVEEAVAVITRVLEEQPGKLAIREVEVTPEKVSYLVSDRIGPTPFKRTLVQTFYYDSLGMMDIHKKGAGYLVRVFDQLQQRKIYVLIADEERAHRFMDSIVLLANQNGDDS